MPNQVFRLSLYPPPAFTPFTENVQNRRVQELFEPPPTKAWVDVAAIYAKVPLEGSQHQPWFVPLIDLITGVASVARAKEFVAVWQLVRLYWLREVFSCRRPPEFATRRAWKSFTVGVFSGSVMQAKNEATITRICFTEFLSLRKIVSLPREDFTFVKGEVPGSIDKKVTTDMVRDTIRKLTDLNFFFDMFETEYLRIYDSPMEIIDRMQPAMSPFNLTVPTDKIPRSRLTDRAAWLAWVRDFIWPWDGKKSKDFELKLSVDPRLDEVAAFEKAVAHVYCSNVTYTLRRRPVLPRYE